jgi:hypothetical protein
MKRTNENANMGANVLTKQPQKGLPNMELQTENLW